MLHCLDTVPRAKLGEYKVLILSILSCEKLMDRFSWILIDPHLFFIPAGSSEGNRRNSLRGDQLLRELKRTIA